MSFVRKVFSRGKKSSSSAHRSVESDWVNDAMTALHLAAEASKMVPVASGFIEGGAHVLRFALERLKQMKQNKEEFKDLTQSTTDLLATLRAAMASMTEPQHSECFTQICSDFEGSIQRLFDGINAIIVTAESKHVWSYLRAQEIREIITKYQKDVIALRDNLMLYCAISTNIQVSEANGKLSVVLQDKARLEEDEFPEFKEVYTFPNSAA
ncbi:hypothetical protein M422DRAFT_266959 [Sphaerobolus stellatus SS14]|uniref:Uncharacterized protein n=1 Tax=Sphaerobolus stellatus (strain SS14) TaxID=990650 RepID=A0A0C9V1U2_SPHS4|nr:hypothetical protein M422DRAFT_266959 [Sphaerobolus stellatus SS14]